MRNLSLPLVASLLLTVPAVAFAADDDDEARDEVESIERVEPAQVLTDPATGKRQVVVPPGCKATRRSSGQIVVLCPSKPEPATVEVPEYVAPVSRKERRWYGWQTLMVDGITLGTTSVLALASSGTDNEGLGALAGTAFVGGYLLGGPIVHWSNGQVGKGFASLGIRAGAPVIVGFTGALVGSVISDGNPWSALGFAVLGVIGGGAAAIALDSAVLARKTVTVEQTAKAPKLQLTPTGGYDPRREAFSFGLAGSF